MTTNLTLDYENKDAPRLTEHQRMVAAEKEFVFLAELAEKADELARGKDHLDRLSPDCLWQSLWILLDQPYESVEAFRAAMKLAPAAHWRKFLDIHRSNTGCFRELLKIVREAKTKRGSFGAKFLAELLRWKTDPGVGTPDDGEPFTVNNNWTAYYSRLLALFDPSLQETLEFRQRGRR